MKRNAVLLGVVAALLASAAFAGTTGKLSGTVADDNGLPLPGVTVTIASPALIGGAQVAVTEIDGNFSFPGLAPGVYTVKAELSGFVSQERNGVEVRLDRTTELNVVMPPSKFGEEITVVAETPVVDPTQVSTSQTFSNDFLKTAAIGSTRRGYQSVLNMAPGVVGTNNPSVFGSTAGENAYFIDGLDTTDPVTATFGTNFNFDAIQEISFQTGGFEAEYGRATGGIVNLVTKSGGNDFSGTLDVRFRDSSFYENGDHFDTDTNEVKYLTPSVTLGGPIIRDNLWFFVSGQYIDSQATPVNSPSTRKYEGENYIGKLTWQVSPNWRVIGKLSGDPATIDNSDASQFVAAEANTYQEQGGSIYQAEFNGVLSPSLLWNTQVGINRSTLDAYPQTGDFDAVSHLGYDTGYEYGSASNAQYSDRNRDEIKTNLTWFVDQLAGSHEFKGGVEYSKLFFRSHNYTTADGYRYDDLTSDYWYGDGDPAAIPYVMWFDTDAGTIENDGTMYTGYLQDAWKPTPTLTVKFGVRYDTVGYTNNAGDDIADMDMFQPRVGIAWDVRGDAKSLIKASYGRFMHPNAMTLPNFARTALSTSYRWRSCSTLRGFSSPEQCQTYAAGLGRPWTEGPDGWDPNGWYQVPSADVFGSAPNQIAADLKPTYADELIIGYEQEVFNRTSIEVSYIDKKTRDIFEDTCDGNVPNPSADATCDYYLMANLPDLKRDYEGVIVKFETRAKDWLNLLASYTYSKSEGNVEYTQNAGVDFDVYPVHFVNTYGYLSDDRRHRVKLNGYVLLPYNFTVGVDGFWSSGFAYSHTAAADPYGDEFLDPRGFYRGNDNWGLDMSASWALKLGAIRTELIATIYNVFGEEQGTGVCESDTGCTGYLPDGLTQVHYDFGDTTSWQTPRRYEVGFRIEF